ncbi:hypothetical protein GCM10029963_15970 [Micromonospora andamanensis]
MYSTAGLQICLDAGQPEHLMSRWRLVHAAGPPLLAAFATAGRHAGRDTGWASARMGAWWRIDPARTAPVWTPDLADRDPVAAWTAYVLAAPLLCVRSDGPDWTAPPDVTFADWIDGALHRPPRVDDLEYHVSTLFPRYAPAATWRSATSTHNPGGAGSCRWRCSAHCSAAPTRPPRRSR